MVLDLRWVRVTDLKTMSGCWIKGVRRARVGFDPSGRWLITSTVDAYRFWSVGDWAPGPVLARDEASGLTGPFGFTGDGQVLVAETSRLRYAPSTGGPAKSWPTSRRPTPASPAGSR